MAYNSTIRKYDKKIGFEVWKKNIVPVYRWYGGKRKIYKLGDKIKTTEAVRCSRCHKRAEEMEMLQHYKKVYSNLKFLDFEKHNYETASATTGGRFYTELGISLPLQ